MFAFFGGLSLVGPAGTALFGVLALLLAVPALVAFVVVRRRRTGCPAPSDRLAVAPPRRKVPAT